MVPLILGNKMKHIIKRKGHTESYDRSKLYASVYAACLSVRVPEGEAELVAEQVCQDTEKWLESKHEVTAHDIRRQAGHHLEVYNPDAAYMYRNHRELHR
jgi:transcriptional regulator NrdR family protein